MMDDELRLSHLREVADRLGSYRYVKARTDGESGLEPGDLTGVREPRRPRPMQPAGAIELSVIPTR